jgi:flagellar biosynthetic protein FlhB
MADDADIDFESKTEAPTPRRREQAAEEGRFAFSTELTTGFVLFSGMAGLFFFGPRLGDDLLNQTRMGLIDIGQRDLSQELVGHIFTSMFARLLAIAGMLVGLLFGASIVANVAQAGLRLSTDKLTFDWSKAMPSQWSRLFSWSKLTVALIMILKIIAVGAVAWWILRHRGGEILQFGDQHLATTLARSWSLILRLAISLAGALLVIGFADYAYQRWQFERSLYMTKQEVKEEHKREEGDPQIKARIRRMQRETAQRKMFQEVPKATVVVTNPTHLAVALRYDPKTMVAPKVIAKGAGFIAKRIVAIARENGVPVLERKPVARMLYKTVKVDRDIPFGLYFIVAEVLAHVYRLKGIKGTNAAGPPNGAG